MPGETPPLQRFLIGGFDPRSPRHEHRRMRRAAAVRPAGEGVRVAVGERQRVDAIADAWALDGGGAVRARFTVLRWDDIVRTHDARGPLAFWRAAWRVWGEGYVGAAWWGIWQCAKPGMGLAAFPLVLALGLIALGAGVAVAALLALGLRAALALPVGLVVGVLLWWAAERRVDSGWMLRLLAFGVDVARGEVAGLEARMDAMAARVGEALREAPEPCTRLIAHSVGSYLAVSVLARALRLPGIPAHARIELLTLGHDIPLLTVQPEAVAFRAELAAVASDPRVDWLDVSAPADWAAFGRTPPWQGLALAPGALRDQVSPRFHTVLTPEHYARLKRDRRALHLQYLHASDVPGGYDWLSLAATAEPLRAWAHRLAAKPTP